MTSTQDIRRRSRPVEPGEWPASVHPVLARVHAQRGSAGQQQALPRLAGLPAPDSLAGLDMALTLLLDARASGRNVLVSADFDCDGATACALMLRGLAMLGFARLGFAVPDRQRHGYGLTPAFVETLRAHAPGLLITVDHGVACHAGIDAARALGWQVLVSDHHLPGDTLPQADAIINPNRRDCAFPAKSLAGVGVAFYLLLALRARLRQQGDVHAAQAQLTRLLDLVAVGTVADLVPLDAVNRALVGAGLRQLRKGEGCAGLNALINVAGRDRATLDTGDLGFAIGPRINAAGRLEDMGLGIACLLSDDCAEATRLAAELHAINAARREMQDDMVDTALARMRLSAEPDAAHCVFDAQWHPGVIGLVAARLVEQYHRPVVTFAPAEPGSSMLRGSARSIRGVHMRDAIARVDVLAPGLIERFGGHAMAAGLTLAHAHLPQFQSLLRDVVSSQLGAELLERVFWSDGGLEAADINHALACALRDGGAWGQGYPEPAFDDVFDILEARQVGQGHLAFALGREGHRWRAIQFGAWREGAWPAQLRLLYRPVPDAWRGGDAVQLRVLHHCATH